MSTKDYQQQRFRARGTDCGTNHGVSAPYSEPPSLSVNACADKTPPRVVTPMAYSPSPYKKDNVESDLATALSPEFFHKPTATNGNTSYISPLKPKEPNLRYSLSKGLEKVASVSSIPKDPKLFNSLRPSSEGTSLRNKSVNSSICKYDPNSYKIFILLLSVSRKTFELIQLLYQPNDTTVGNILEMIPENATEAALGNQVYVGLCRPKTKEEILDKDLLASESHSGVVSAKISLGEILVAIPEGYTGADVAVLAKQILANPKIIKLLKRADPLAPKKSRRSSKRHRSSRRSRSKEHVEVMEKFDEEDEIKLEQERKMKEAMAHAAQEAAAANARIPGGGSKPVSLARAMSITSLEDKSVESSLQESLDDSYSSWSKSFDASFASSVCSGVSKRQMRRRERQVRRSRILKRAAAMAFVIMLALYFLDPRGYARPDKEKNETIMESPMGMTGVFQCLFLLLTLYKIERFVRSSNNPEVRAQGGQKHRCPFLLAANSAVKKLKMRYSRKLKKPIVQESFGEDEQSLSRKLRNFSLKANHMHSYRHDSDAVSFR
ncbi:hypothetical protein IV203_029535 [Nitzschia inconspicua]|uniref:Uncharacterized protein n=1 Tax=Nitzschia inconspicua TaxID=303405 RepID=A0A9K3Q1B8_9STRA|nr:hypothetical protein IV203_029535 [Nitzschia inconspicua]